MPLPSQPLHVPAGLPIDESIRPELVDAGKANLANVNVRLAKKGGLSKRLGYGSLTRARLDATTRSAGARMVAHGESTLIIDGSTVDVYANDAAYSIPRGRLPECSVSTRPVASYAGSASYTALLAFGVVGDYAAYAYASDEYSTAGIGSLVLFVEDIATGAVVRAPEIIYTCNSIGSGYPVAKIVSYSTYLVVIFADYLAATIHAYYLDTTSAATITTGWVQIGTSVAIDKLTPGGGGSVASSSALAAQSLTNRVAFAYVNNSGGASQLTIKTISISGVIESTTRGTNSVTPTCVAIDGSIADTLWVAWDETTTIRLYGIDADSLSTLLAGVTSIMTLASSGPATIGIVSSATAGKGRIVASDGTPYKWHMRGFQTQVGTTSTDGAQQTVRNSFLGSLPFRCGSRYYVAAQAGSGSAGIICDITEDQGWVRPIATIAPELAVSSITRVESLGSSRYAVPIVSATSGTTRSARLATLDFADRNRWRSTQHNGATYFAGGVLSYFDGVRAAEAAFVVKPTTPTTTDAGTGITGNFRYVLVYEEVDANGDWCVSGISSPSTVATVTNKTITVTMRPCSITARQRRAGGNEVRLALYRTGSTGEPPYYRLTAVQNNTASDTITYADSASDVTANAQLYSPTLPGSGSAQDRRCPPYCQDVVSYNGMLVVASGSDLWWSGQAVRGEGVWFSPLFQVPVEGPGDITALATQDGTLYALKRDAIYSVSGEPPSDNGAAGGLGTPRRLACDVGCIDPCSVVVTSAGIFFQSERGIELLTRAGAVMWIGEQVQDTLASFPVVSSAVLDAKASIVRFSLAASESSGLVSGEGRDLIFDLTVNGWVSVDDKRGGSAHQASQDACMIYYDSAWRYAWLGTDGTVYYERDDDDADAYLDDTYWVTAQYEMPAIKVGLQQEQRIYEIVLLTERHSDAGITVEIAHDYGAYAAVDANKVWTAAQTSGEKQFPLRPKPQSTAIQLRVKDTQPSGSFGTGQGFTFIGLSADVAPKQGSTRGTPRLDTSLRR